MLLWPVYSGMNSICSPSSKQTYQRTIRLEEMRVKRRDPEQWMVHSLLPENLRERRRRCKQFKWQETRGVDEIIWSAIFRDVKRHLCVALDICGCGSNGFGDSFCILVISSSWIQQPSWGDAIFLLAKKVLAFYWLFQSWCLLWRSASYLGSGSPFLDRPSNLNQNCPSPLRGRGFRRSGRRFEVCCLSVQVNRWLHSRQLCLTFQFIRSNGGLGQLAFRSLASPDNTLSP